MNPSLISKAAGPARVLAQNAPKIQCLKKGAQLHTAAWRAGSENRSSLRKRTRAPSAKRVSSSIPIDKILHSDMNYKIVRNIYVIIKQFVDMFNIYIRNNMNCIKNEMCFLDVVLLMY